MGPGQAAPGWGSNAATTPIQLLDQAVQTTKPDESSTTALAEHSTPQPEPVARQSGVREPLGTRIRPNKAVDPRKIVIQQHIDIFFQSNEMVSPGPGWLEEAEREVLRDIDSISIPKLQILLLLTFDCTAKGRLSAVWYLSSLASRIAYALKLNYPTDAVVFTNQECRRRLMWCTYLLDKMIEGAGSPYPPLCPSDSIHLQLPCNSRLFELELDCDTDSLNDMASNNLQHVTNLGVTAYLIRILDLRNQIQQYLTSERAKSGVQLPWSVESPLWIFKQQLTNFEDQLPAEMQNTERALYLRIHTPVADVYTMVHTWLHTTACELFGGVLRDVFPILHEDPNNDAPESEDSSYIMSQPPEFRSFCMAEIAKHFTTLNQFWSQMHSVQTLSKRFFLLDTKAQKVLDAISRSPHRSIADEYLKTRSGSMDQEHWLPPTGHDGGSLDGESQLSPAFFGLYAQGLYADDGTSILGDSPLHFDPHGLLMPDTFGGAPEIVGQAHQLSRSA
ncbi:hypothetical protein GQ53DRAFT_763917 [Thozetella sp. PMI_491]|nr:hypothetical protein GQ53DRAFT_763917 [Thozetella sp. PMI_491]